MKTYAESSAVVLPSCLMAMTLAGISILFSFHAATIGMVMTPGVWLEAGWGFGDTMALGRLLFRSGVILLAVLSIFLSLQGLGQRHVIRWMPEVGIAFSLLAAVFALGWK